MANVDWLMRGQHLKNCNCAYGCPCDFNAVPTNVECTGMVGMHIDEGHFGEVPLDGLSWAATYHWPGPLHEGNGTLQPVIDIRANEQQRDALLTILSGKEQVEGTFFHIISLIVSTVLEPKFVPIEFEFDLDARTARMAAEGVFETTSEPIRNPVTGAPHRVRVDMPEGFEYRLAEIARASIRGSGEIGFDNPDCHSSMAQVTVTPDGVTA